MAANSPGLTQTRSKWIINIKIRALLGSFWQMDWSIWGLITWVPILSNGLFYAFIGRDSHTVRHLYVLNPCCWRLVHSNFGIFFAKKMCHDFQSADGSTRWQTSFNFNHTPHAGTLPSTGHCRDTAQLLLYAPEEETFCSPSKSHTDCVATRNWPIILNYWYLELITD